MKYIYRWIFITITIVSATTLGSSFTDSLDKDWSGIKQNTNMCVISADSYKGKFKITCDGLEVYSKEFVSNFRDYTDITSAGSLIISKGLHLTNCQKIDNSYEFCFFSR